LGRDPARGVGERFRGIELRISKLFFVSWEIKGLEGGGIMSKSASIDYFGKTLVIFFRF
jgi:hypothetical protein